MSLNSTNNTRQPLIIKYNQVTNNGIRLQILPKYCIGYVVKGTKYIYNNNQRHIINKGEMFYFSTGQYYLENTPGKDDEFEEIIFLYSPVHLNKILNDLSLTFKLKIENNHFCNKCTDTNYIICDSWSGISVFFDSIKQYIQDNIFNIDSTGEEIKMTELIYLILLGDKCCIKNKILNNNDIYRVNFEQIVQSNIFNNLSIDELASMCNKSLTTFKKEFKEYFNESPHKWFINERLVHTRLLLISTNKSISEISNECNFTNTSHFIKLFKRKYSMTPSNFRTQNKQINMNQTQIIAENYI